MGFAELVSGLQQQITALQAQLSDLEAREQALAAAQEALSEAEAVRQAYGQGRRDERSRLRMLVDIQRATLNSGGINAISLDTLRRHLEPQKEGAAVR